jgi:hypothetical protein
MEMVALQPAKEVATRAADGLLAAIHNHVHGVQNPVDLHVVFARAYKIGEETRNSGCASQEVRRRV